MTLHLPGLGLICGGCIRGLDIEGLEGQYRSLSFRLDVQWGLGMLGLLTLSPVQSVLCKRKETVSIRPVPGDIAS